MCVLSFSLCVQMCVLIFSVCSALLSRDWLVTYGQVRLWLVGLMRLCRGRGWSHCCRWWWGGRGHCAGRWPGQTPPLAPPHSRGVWRSSPERVPGCCSGDTHTEVFSTQVFSTHTHTHKLNQRSELKQGDELNRTWTKIDRWTKTGRWTRPDMN